MRKNQENPLPAIQKFFPEPQENYNVWERLVGKKIRNNYLTDYIAPIDEIEKVRKYFGILLQSQKRSRLCLKFTGPPRINYFKQIFTDAVFINIIRDPRSIVASLMNVKFWKKRGLTEPYWRYGLKKKFGDIIKLNGKTPIELAAVQLKIINELMSYEAKKTRAKYLEIKYEDFVKNPNKVVNIIQDYCGLKDSKKIKNYLKLQNYKNMNHKYKKYFSEREIKKIEEITQKYLVAKKYN